MMYFFYALLARFAPLQSFVWKRMRAHSAHHQTSLREVYLEKAVAEYQIAIFKFTRDSPDLTERAVQRKKNSIEATLRTAALVYGMRAEDINKTIRDSDGDWETLLNPAREKFLQKNHSRLYRAYESFIHELGSSLEIETRAEALHALRLFLDERRLELSGAGIGKDVVEDLLSILHLLGVEEITYLFGEQDRFDPPPPPTHDPVWGLVGLR